MKLRVGVLVLIIGLVLIIVGYAVKENDLHWRGCTNPCKLLPISENLQPKIEDIIFYIGSITSLCGIGLSVVSLIQKFQKNEI